MKRRKEQASESHVASEGQFQVLPRFISRQTHASMRERLVHSGDVEGYGEMWSVYGWQGDSSDRMAREQAHEDIAKKALASRATHILVTGEIMSGSMVSIHRTQASLYTDSRPRFRTSTKRL